MNITITKDQRSDLFESVSYLFRMYQAYTPMISNNDSTLLGLKEGMRHLFTAKTTTKAHLYFNEEQLSNTIRYCSNIYTLLRLEGVHESMPAVYAQALAAITKIEKLFLSKALTKK